MKVQDKILLAFIIVSNGWYHSFAQTLVKGVVTDSETREPIPFVNVYFKGTSIGKATNLRGEYSINSEQIFTEVQFSYLGYKTITKKIGSNLAVINVRMSIEEKLLEEVTVRSKKGKEKYRNKDNPAVDLVKEMIEHRESNRLKDYDYKQYQRYEKMMVSLSNNPEKFKSGKLYKKYKFFFDNIDTTTLYGKALLPIYLKEDLTEHYHRKAPQQEKVIKIANQNVSFDDYIDNQGLNTYLNFLYNDVDLYDNNILILTNQFLSPIADLAPTFYKFYLTDTLKDVTPNLVELTFVPRNQGSFLFQGRLWVTLDENFAVQKVDMGINKNINLNWVRDLRIVQNFEKTQDGRFHLAKAKMMVDFGLTSTRGGIFGERTISFKDYFINQPKPDSFYGKNEEASLGKLANRNEDYWTSVRHDTLSNAESKVYRNIDSIQKVPSFKRTVDIATLLLAGYKRFGKWELGPANTFYSFNPVEGFRLRVGGRSTPKFNERLYFETYAAYGFKDERWKYFLSSTYSFTGNSIWQFPLRTLTASYQQETKIPGQELQFVQEDNILLSFKRGVNDKWLYNNIATISYLHEFENNFSYRLSFKNWEQSPAGGLRYERRVSDTVLPIEKLTTSEFLAEVRWAPRQQFYQGKLYRVPIFNQYPIITLRVIGGIKGLINGGYNYQNVALNVFKRFYLSQFGFSDVVVEGGYLVGSVPFPLLNIHRANQSYSYQIQSYNLMNFLEFVSDQYVSLHIDHSFNGFVFNKIPLLKKLKWREVATVKILYGGLRRENDPTYNSSLFVFPSTGDGITTTYTFKNEPYIEGSIGIGNIFKLFRIDLVKRFTYLDNPNVPEWGIRGRFKFDF
jgi:hypothetical protein